jgi:hypothetical protein
MSDNGIPGGDRRPDIEIIPPDPNRARSQRAQSRVWISIDTSRGQTRGVSGLFGIIVAILLVTFVTAVVLMLLLGALLIWVPVVALAVAAALIAGLLRRRFQSRDPDGGSVPDQPVRGPDNVP